ncbi:MAG: hypothetical protein LBG86_00165 [Puniceicoccales bacterium]|nr:hypothetical protein [Puniceicoccales bacterium]
MIYSSTNLGKIFHKQPWNRIWTFYIILISVYVYLVFGLFWRQILQHRHFLAKERQQSHRRILTAASRGNIYDRNGRLLAGNRLRFSLVAYLNELQAEFAQEYRRRTQLLRREELPIDVSLERSRARLGVLRHHLELVEKHLGKEIPISRHAIDRHHAQQLLLPMVICDDLPADDFAKLVELLPPDGPLQWDISTVRHYPYGSAAAHIIGYASSSVDFSDEDFMGKQFKTFAGRGSIGRAGIEESMNEVLRGVNGGSIWIVDPSGKKCQKIFSQSAMQGTDVTLSMDIDLQKIAEEAIRGEIGCAILMDVQTGEVLAMANSPSFNLNDLTPRISTKTYEAINADGAWINQCIQGIYPVGSIFKLVAAEIFLQRGIVNRTTEHSCHGHTTVGNRIIRCANHYERGNLSFPRALAKSCNSLFVDLIFKVPLDDFIGEICRFGFGKRTGIELPHETCHSLVPTPQWKKVYGYSRWTDGDTANLVLGQGYLLATPLQVNAFTASLAGRRMRTRPTILRASRDISLEGESLPLSSEAYETLLEGMCGCVEYGSGHRCHIDGLSIAAKTGTAQIRSDNQSSHLAWFTAFAPAGGGKIPRVAVTVMLREPFNGRAYGGGSDAAPAARKILRAYFQDRKDDAVSPFIAQ